MVTKVLDLLFGCRHKRLTRPITPMHRYSTATISAGAYVACLDCGRQFHYDPENLRMGAPIPMAAPTHSSDSYQTQY